MWTPEAATKCQTRKLADKVLTGTDPSSRGKLCQLLSEAVAVLHIFVIV
eukprot:CAMPEP_0194539510 /NCGR_PEP_ID=MMETSP0253-20130528/79491_1 /TAXON_ID=2966 /ORGANISM="Noctiluca scintillans" /LENGTH=48 /DNA_ID= /DNA_START= /DNA_END= /DNA_ORIENTATION=